MSPSSPDVMDDMDAGQVTVDVGDMAVVDVVDRQGRLACHWDTGSGVDMSSYAVWSGNNHTNTIYTLETE